MKPKHVYLALCVVGTVVPLIPFVPFLGEHGLDLERFVVEMFANRDASFFALDVIVSAIALWTLVAIEGRRAGMRHRWAPVAASPGGRRVSGPAALPLSARARRGASRIEGGRRLFVVARAARE